MHLLNRGSSSTFLEGSYANHYTTNTPCSTFFWGAFGKERGQGTQLSTPSTQGNSTAALRAGDLGSASKTAPALKKFRVSLGSKQVGMQWASQWQADSGTPFTSQDAEKGGLASRGPEQESNRAPTGSLDFIICGQRGSLSSRGEPSREMRCPGRMACQ